jgi:hypothetical protein
MDEQGQAQYLVLSRGGFLTVGAELVAVPWALARPQMRVPDDAWWGETVTINLDERTLETAPRLDRGRFDDDVAGVDWQHVVNYWQQVAEQPAAPGAIAGAPDYFRAFDLNRDGAVTREELQTVMQLARRLNQQFAQVDQAGDGVISASEFAQFEQQLVPQQ